MRVVALGADRIPSPYSRTRAKVTRYGDCAAATGRLEKDMWHPSAVVVLTLAATMVMALGRRVGAQGGFYGPASLRSAITQWRSTPPGARSLVSDYFLDCALAEPNTFYRLMAEVPEFTEWLSEMPHLSFALTSRSCSDLKCLRHSMLEAAKRAQVEPQYAAAQRRLVSALQRAVVRASHQPEHSPFKDGYTSAGLAWYIHYLWEEAGPSEAADVSNTFCEFVIHNPEMFLRELKNAGRLQEWLTQVADVSLVDWGEPGCGQGPACIRRLMIASLKGMRPDAEIQREKAALLDILQNARIRRIQQRRGDAPWKPGRDPDSPTTEIFSMARTMGSASYGSNDFPIATTPTRDNVFLSNLLVGSYCSNTLGGALGWTYYYADHLGSPRKTSGAESTARKYWLYGDEVSGAGSTAQRLKFATMERDVENNHFYDHARAHDFTFARFLSLDKSAGRSLHPFTWNRYTYALDNPLRFVDPNGLSWLEFNRATNQIALYSHSGQRLGTFPASNNPQHGLASPLELGRRYPFQVSRDGTDTRFPNFHPNLSLDSPTGPYGVWGDFRLAPFRDREGRIHVGVAIHAGRDGSAVVSAGRELADYEYPTDNCLRTCESAMQRIATLAFNDPLEYLVVVERPTSEPVQVATTGVAQGPCPNGNTVSAEGKCDK
jgi:RHS repeat-associated protein